MCMFSDIPAEYGKDHTYCVCPVTYKLSKVRIAPNRYIIFTCHLGMVGTLPNGYVTGTSQLGQVQTAPTKRVIMTSYLCALQTIR